MSFARRVPVNLHDAPLSVSGTQGRIFAPRELRVFFFFQVFLGLPTFMD